MPDETQDQTTQQDQTQDQTASGQTGGAGDKPAESTKATLPNKFEDLSEEQKALYLQGARDFKAHQEREAAKNPPKEIRRETSRSDDDPNAPLEKEVKKLIKQAMSEAGPQGDAEAVLTKLFTKAFVAQSGLTEKRSREIAEEMVGPLREAIVDGRADKFFGEYKYLDPVKGKMRKLIEEHGAPVDLVMDIVETLRPKSKASDDEDNLPTPRKTAYAADDFSFIEEPSNRGSVPQGSASRSKQAAEAAKAAMDAEAKGDKAARDAALKKYLRLRPRAA